MRQIWVVSLCGISAFAQTNVRLTNDTVSSGGYVSLYTLATGTPYTDDVIGECSKARGRQNEPSVAINPRNTNVILGSSNDYCGVYAGSPDGGPFIPSGPIWLGYYRSENGGSSFRSSLVPGYPGDSSPYAALSNARTASSGDPVIAWDAHGRAYFGSESSGDPAGTKKSFGDVWVAAFDNPAGASGNTINDGKRYKGTQIVAKGVSAPNLNGKFQDKTAIEADRTGGACDANVYFAWTSFSGIAGNVAIYFSRSTNQGTSWSQPQKLTPAINSLQDPDIAVTGNGHVYVTFQQYASRQAPDAVMYVKSVDCGRTFSPPQMLTPFTRYAAQDISTPTPIPQKFIDDPLFDADPSAAGSLARDCGDFDSACASGYTFFRRDTSPRSTADQFDSQHEYVYVVYEASKPGTQVNTGTTYGSISPGVGSQSGIYFMRLNGATGVATNPVLLDNETVGHQFFADISADGGTLHALWWDSRNDPSYSPMRPVGNDATRGTHPSLDVYYTKSTNLGASWSTAKRQTSVTSNPNYEQFSNRVVPFAGDYLWISSLGSAVFGAWTDWRNTVAGTDPREASAEDNDGADVKQCRVFDTATGTWSGDQCPRAGGLDQDIFGAALQ